MQQSSRPPKQRQQAPALFIPPTRDSHTAKASKPTREEVSDRQGNVSNDGSHPYRGGVSSASSGAAGNSATPARNPKSEGKRADITWTEMQNTLEEVELNAASGANVFSSDHARALEDLRKAQIGLAQAWARTEAEDEASADIDLLSGQDRRSGRSAAEAGGRRGAVHGHQKEESKASTTGTGSTDATGPKANPSSGRDHSQLEEETENDIRLARQRREANDRYFERVSKGVAVVVNQLETVAGKMRDVETASQDIWGSEQDSLAS